MAKTLLSLPYVGLVVKIISLCVIAVLVVASAISYCGYTSLESSLEQMRRTNADSRAEIARLESEVKMARTRIDGHLERERSLRDETESLRQEALQLERDWEEVKAYKRRIEESGEEIEKIRKRIRELDK